MRILVVVTRFPEPRTKGDQQRAYTWISGLAQRHAVTVVTSGRPRSAAAADALLRHAHLLVVAPSPVPRLASTVSALLRGLPAQTGWMMPARTWRTVREQAGAADVVLAMTVRSIRAPSLGRPLVLDHVDALSLNMARRARGPEVLPVRLAARFEASRLRAWETRLGRVAAVQVVTSDEDAGALGTGPVPVVLPVALDALAWQEPPGHRRDIDVIFTGNMAYPPNRTAATEFAERVLPLVRAQIPGLRAAIVGRRANRLNVRADGLQVVSDVPDLDVWLRRARVAVAPLSGGTGTPYKVLEAAANGAAVVATPWVAERFGMRTPVADDAAGIAAHVARLLGDERARAAAAREGYAAVGRHLAEALTARLETAMSDAVARRTQGTTPPR